MGRGLVDRIACFLRGREQSMLQYHTAILNQVREGHERTVDLFCERIDALENQLRQAYDRTDRLGEKLADALRQIEALRNPLAPPAPPPPEEEQP